MIFIDDSKKKIYPFTHWVFNKVFTENIVEELSNINLKPLKYQKQNGTREINNATRFFLNNDNCLKYPIFKSVVNIFQQKNNIIKLENISGSNLQKGKLRIEYAMDEGDFWLEPHLDIKEKLLTFLIYLSGDLGSDQWGTTLYNSDLTYHSQVPYRKNLGFMFVAGNNTWHGFEKQKIDGIRKCLIINYVTNDWKNIHELAPKFK